MVFVVTPQVPPVQEAHRSRNNQRQQLRSKALALVQMTGHQKQKHTHVGSGAGYERREGTTSLQIKSVHALLHQRLRAVLAAIQPLESLILEERRDGKADQTLQNIGHIPAEQKTQEVVH